MKAADHSQEAARLAALRRYNILDTPREADFDAIVLLASRICNTPISVINLIDADRQWFKAEIGLGTRETPLETSLCAHVILEDDFVEIADTLTDPRMRDNPLCLAQPGLRFYAGALLKSPEGLPVGTLCVLDHMPRRLDDLQRLAVETLAAQVVAQLDLRATIAREAVLRQEIDHRVKNSLQSVSSFVALERGTATSAPARDVLGRVAQQIDAVAALHGHLAVHGEHGTIEIASYSERVIDLLDKATPERVRIERNFAPRRIAANDAAALATILNELVSNAVKHSFSDRGGTIRLQGCEDGAIGYVLICEDDGQPPTPADDDSERKGLGFAIMAASVEQLGGVLTRSTGAAHFTTRIICQLPPC